MFDPKNLLYTVRKETKCSEETEILHEQVHEATRKSESHELIRVIYSKKRVVTKHTNKQTSRGFELTIEMRSYHMKIKKKSFELTYNISIIMLYLGKNSVCVKKVCSMKAQLVYLTF